MKSIDLLREEEKHSRVYRTHTPIRREVLWHVSDMNARIPGIDWTDCCKFPNIAPRKDSYDIEVKHMIHWGRADARIIEDAFHVVLPNYVHEFYSEIQECVLNWKYSYHILRPEDVVDWETFYRGEEGKHDLPFNLIRFCKVSSSSDSIAFRKNTRTGQWNIVYSSLYISTEEFQSAKYDSDYLAEDLDAFIFKLTSSDGILHSDDRKISNVVRVTL